MHRASSTQENSLERRERPHILACFRESPRPCINQDLVDALQPLRALRVFEHGGQSEKAISYATAISVIIGTPYRITSREQALELPKIGDKLINYVAEFLRTGSIQESCDVLASERYRALKAFTQVHGIGNKKARELWDAGYRSLDDLRCRPQFGINWAWHDDIQRTMTREDVESVAAYIKVQLDKVEPGAHTVLCGGYRRGKTASNDVDLLITYPHEDGRERGVLSRLLDRLCGKGLIPPDGVLSQSNCATDRTAPDNKSATMLDSLDRAFVVFRHPPNRTTRPTEIYRRLDLIVTRWPSFGSAVVGWTGSTQFERDLRTHAHGLGYKFDSGGIHRLSDNTIVPAVTEEDVFRVLKLQWIPPELRNADP